MSVGQIGHEFGQHLEPDKKAVQWIVVKVIRAGEQFVE
jgi:hypothetical protein